MNKTSMPLKLRADLPIDPTTASVVRAVQHIASGLGLEVCLIGATARIIMLEHVHGVRAGRATDDVDFAFAVKDWAQFQAVRQQLIDTSRFEEIKGVAHRLSCKVQGSPHKALVDLVPFGGIERDGNIAWPPDENILMSVAGFQDVCAAATPVELEHGLVIPIATLPGIAILKLFAWADRGKETPKDATDLLVLLRAYHEAGNQERAYKDAAAVLEAAGFDIEQAGAWLLGRDARAIARQETRQKLGQMFNHHDRMEQLLADMSKDIRARDDAIAYSRVLLQQFLAGFNCASQ